MRKATWADAAALQKAYREDKVKDELMRQAMKQQQEKHTGYKCPECGEKLYEDGPIEYCLECGYKHAE